MAFLLTANKPATPPVAKENEAKQSATASKSETTSDDEDGDGVGRQGDVQPVGHDYVEEVGVHLFLIYFIDSLTMLLKILRLWYVVMQVYIFFLRCVMMMGR